jgi:hypothetical protein
MAQAEGDNEAILQVLGGNFSGGDIFLASGAELVARTDLAGGVLTNVQKAIVSILGDTVTLNGDIEASTKNGGSSSGSATVAINSRAGLDINHDVVAVGSLSSVVRLTASSDITATGAGQIVSKRLVVDAGGNATVRGFTADSFSGTAVNGDLTVEAPGDLHMTAANAVNGSVRVTAGGLLTTNPFITAASTGLVDLSANGIVINPNSGFVQGGTINLDGGTGDVLIYSGLSARNGTNSGGVVSVSAAGDILVANTASIIASQSGSAGLATVTLGGGSITPGSVTVLGSVSALGNATLVAVRAGNLISIDGALRAITPALDNVGGTILLSDATTIAGAGLVQAARLQVTGAGGDVFLSNVQTPSFEISSTPGLVDVTNTAPAATLLFAGSSFGSSVIFQTSGSLEVLNSTSNLQIGGNAEFRAGGSLTMRDNLTANGDLFVQAGGLAQFGRVAPSPTFSAANITVLTGGTVSIISATMDAATVTIDAGTDVLLGSTLGSVNLVSTGQTQLSAGGRILSSVAAGNGLIDAGALSALAGNTIDFGNLDLIVHNGVATPVVGGPGVGDPALITEHLARVRGLLWRLPLPQVRHADAQPGDRHLAAVDRSRAGYGEPERGRADATV